MSHVSRPTRPSIFTRPLIAGATCLAVVAGSLAYSPTADATVIGTVEITTLPASEIPCSEPGRLGSYDRISAKNNSPVELTFYDVIDGEDTGSSLTLGPGSASGGSITRSVGVGEHTGVITWTDEAGVSQRYTWEFTVAVCQAPEPSVPPVVVSQARPRAAVIGTSRVVYDPVRRSLRFSNTNDRSNKANTYRGTVTGNGIARQVGARNVPDGTYRDVVVSLAAGTYTFGFSGPDGAAKPVRFTVGKHLRPTAKVVNAKKGLIDLKTAYPAKTWWQDWSKGKKKSKKRSVKDTKPGTRHLNTFNVKTGASNTVTIAVSAEGRVQEIKVTVRR